MNIYITKYTIFYISLLSYYNIKRIIYYRYIITSYLFVYCIILYCIVLLFIIIYYVVYCNIARRAKNRLKTRPPRLPSRKSTIYAFLAYFGVLLCVNVFCFFKRSFMKPKKTGRPFISRLLHVFGGRGRVIHLCLTIWCKPSFEKKKKMKKNKNQNSKNATFDNSKMQ